MPATLTDRRPPGDLAVVEMLLADPTLLIEEARAACDLPYTDEPLPAPPRVVRMLCPGRPGGWRYAVGESLM